MLDKPSSLEEHAAKRIDTSCCMSGAKSDQQCSSNDTQGNAGAIRAEFASHAPDRLRHHGDCRQHVLNMDMSLLFALPGHCKSCLLAPGYGTLFYGMNVISTRTVAGSSGVPFPRWFCYKMKFRREMDA
jgi:hypothetical protein